MQAQQAIAHRLPGVEVVSSNYPPPPHKVGRHNLQALLVMIWLNPLISRKNLDKCSTVFQRFFETTAPADTMLLCNRLRLLGFWAICSMPP